MDKKAKHRIDLLNQRLQKLRMQLAGAKKQVDEPDEISRLEREIATVTEEVEKLKQQ
jgi:archaellum component FlaC